MIYLTKAIKMTLEPTFLLLTLGVCFVVLRITGILRKWNQPQWHSGLWFTHLSWNHTLQRHIIARAQMSTDAQRKVKPYAIGKPASQHSKASSLSTVQITTQRLASPPVYAHIWGAPASLPVDWLKYRAQLMDSAVLMPESDRTTSQTDTSSISRPVSTVDKMRFAGL